MDDEVKLVESAGAEFEFGQCLGGNLRLEELKEEYDAVYLAVGAQKGMSLGVKGEKAKGVFSAVDILKSVSMGEKVKIGKRVAVIGGGFTAVDSARTAVRLGAKEVKLVCLEAREDMPAFEWDIQDAIGEGIEIDCSWGPEEILGDNKGKAKEISFVRCTSVFSSAGEFSPLFDRSVRKSYQVDSVIIATGQVSNLSFLGEEVQIAPEIGGRVVGEDGPVCEYKDLFCHWVVDHRAFIGRLVSRRIQEGPFVSD